MRSERLTPICTPPPAVQIPSPPRILSCNNDWAQAMWPQLCDVPVKPTVRESQ